MADSTTKNSCVHHIETYVDSSSSKSPAQQEASLDAITKLLMNDIITLESLIIEMDMYLTTTDNIIRARGILLLAELLTRLSSKALENKTVHSLILFFAEKLSDWRALRGALVGCLALMKRKVDTGAINGDDASAVAQSFMSNIQVQSLGQLDRKLCFEILECLLVRYPHTVLAIEDDFVYTICESIDQEKDPECLLIAFRLVEMLARLCFESSNSFASYAEDLFNILGTYFPIHFTHPKGEDDVKREKLSEALMLAFASTPLFEPFSIPLFLEKLSSSLPSSKIESLKYLSCCIVKYGSNRMLKHNGPLWASLKDTIFTATSSLTNDSGPHDNKVIDEALVLLQKLIQQDDDGSFLNLILNDVDISMTLKSYSNKDNDITVTDKQRSKAVGSILYVSAAASNRSCSAIFQSFFSGLVNGLDSIMQEKNDVSDYNMFGNLFVCVELLAACQMLVKPRSITYPENEIWCSMLHSLCSSLTSSLTKIMNESARDIYAHSAVRGLQILASFPGSFLAVSKSTFENILQEFISVIILKFDNSSLWGSVLNALVEIGSLTEKSNFSEKISSFDVIIVDRMMGMLSDDDCAIPFSLKAEAVTKIGMINLKYMVKIVQEMNMVISTNLHKYWVDGNKDSAEHAIILLKSYTDTVLPWFQSNQDSKSNDVIMKIVLKIWVEIEKSTIFVGTHKEKKLLETTMDAMKYGVAICSVDNQRLILDKAFSILSSSTAFQDDESIKFDIFTCRDEWIISLFDSVIIALDPKTHLKNIERVLKILVKALLNGHVSSAHALGSLFNKMPSNENIFEEAIDKTFIKLSVVDNLRSRNDNVNAIVGLSWMGKGLIMRGHEKVKDVIKFFLNRLIPNGDGDNPISNGDYEDVMRAFADSFSIIMSDSEFCLNKRLHANVKPLYKQRLFNMVMPILLESIVKSDSPITRSMLHRALAHVVSNTPLSAIMGEAKKLIPLMVDGLTILSEDFQNRDIVYNLLLVLSGILTDKNGEETVVENASIIIRCLNTLVSYPHMMLVRETAIQCLTVMSELPYTRVYPFRSKVLQALLRALDDPKRSVRQEAVKCRQAWASISSRSLQI